MYTVTLRTVGFELAQPLEVLKDPNSGGSEPEIQEQVTMVREIRESVDSVVALIDEIEWIRVETQLVQERNADHAAAEEIRQAGATLEAELINLEMRLFDVRLTGGSARQDTLRWARRLYARLTSLAGYITGTDDRPTDQSREVLKCSEVSWGTTSVKWWPSEKTLRRSTGSWTIGGSTRSGELRAPWAGSGDSFSCVWKGRGIDGPPPASAFLHRLRWRTVCGGPSIPLPLACSLEPNTVRPGLLGGFGR